VSSTQAEFWNTAGGESWVRGQRELDLQLELFGALALDRAAVQPGEAVLDVGCGCGTTTAELAARVGPSGRVVGADISAPMLERARATVTAPHVEFLLGDAGSMPLPTGAFDVLFSRFGVMFFDDPVAAFAHLRAALRASGRIACVVWQPITANPWATVPFAAVADLVEPISLGDADTPGPFSFGDSDRLRDVLARAGFANVELEGCEPDVVLGGGLSFDDSVDFAVDHGPLRRVLESASEEVRGEARVRLRAALEPFATDAGVVLRSAVWVGTARASSA